ncbi:polysaccharide deacetylase family protein [Enterococcus faecalis]|uniref:polysaccharide deacetylase family protein n=1 Tax=Enterococcus faecalis TaxID=1351 RepID=UPI0025AFB7F6|nr:polysaccharide deacetylase family protein [Enterococcus faecalis]MDN3201484.1 polysaccharide deacetylase family protein [Enterococcus faecalis]
MNKFNRIGLTMFYLTVIIMFCTYIFSQTEQLIKNEKTPDFSYRRLPDEDGVIILCYHRVLEDNVVVNSVSKISQNSQLHRFNIFLNDFKQQIKDLKKRKVSIFTMKQFIEKCEKKELTGRSVVITFDDVDVTLPNNVFPILEKENIPFTAFIITGKTGKNLSGSQMASWGQIKTLAKSRIATFGLHTHDLHYQENGKPILSTNLSKEVMIHDYKESQKKFEEQLGYQSTYFAYPYGAKNQYLTNYMNKDRIKGIFSLETGIATNETQLIDVPRLIVTNENWQALLQWLDNK